MTKLQKINNIITSILMLTCAIILICDPADGYAIVLGIIEISLLITSIRGFVYYFTMARYMVDSRRILYKNLFIFDLSIFLLSIMSIPSSLLVVYIAYVMGFAAVIDIIYAISAKKLKSPVWYRKFIYGLVELTVCIVSLCYISNMSVMAYAYALLIVYKAIILILETANSKAMVYVQ